MASNKEFILFSINHAIVKLKNWTASSSQSICQMWLPKVKGWWVGPDFYLMFKFFMSCKWWKFLSPLRRKLILGSIIFNLCHHYHCHCYHHHRDFSISPPRDEVGEWRGVERASSLVTALRRGPRRHPRDTRPRLWRYKCGQN